MIFGFDIEWGLLVGLFAAALADLYFRWMAFGVVDSVAIDICLYTTLFTAYEAFTTSGTEKTDWSFKAVVCGACLLLLIGVHTTVLRSSLNRRISKYEREFVESLPEKSRLLGWAAIDVAKRVVPVTINPTESGIRKGKFETLSEITTLFELVRRTGDPTPAPADPASDTEDPTQVIKDEVTSTQDEEGVPIAFQPFVLDRRTRVVLGLLFSSAAIISLLAPAITRH